MDLINPYNPKSTIHPNYQKIHRNPDKNDSWGSPLYHPRKRINSNKYIKTTFQASSPDEIALVEYAITLNMRLKYRDDKKIEILNANNQIEEYEILAEFPFTSESKRMGIIVRNIEHGHIIFYMFI